MSDLINLCSTLRLQYRNFMMRRFIDAVRLAAANKNWYGALAIALTLPDVCGRLENPQAGTGARYMAWFRKWVEPAYTADLVGKPHVFLAAEDCYALRCSYLHEGNSDITEQRARKALDEFHFVICEPGGISMHMNKIDKSLQLDVEIFCNDIATAVEKWLPVANTDENVRKRMNNLLRIADMAKRESVPGVIHFEERPRII